MYVYNSTWKINCVIMQAYIWCVCVCGCLFSLEGMVVTSVGLPGNWLSSIIESQSSRKRS